MNIRKPTPEEQEYRHATYIINDDWDVDQFGATGEWQISLTVSPSIENYDDPQLLIDGLGREIEYLENLRDMIKEFGPNIKVETDFYWGDEDLLIRITIPDAVFQPFIKGL